MLERLQEKWNVSAGRLVLILITFAVGGSLTGYLGKKLMSFLNIGNPAIWLLVYIIVVTFIWPLMVLAVSIFTGQFLFFRKYLAKMGSRFKGKNQKVKEKMVDSEAQGKSVAEAFPAAEVATGSRKSIVIFASGAGSNAQQIINYFRDEAGVNVSLIVCNKPGAGVLSIAEKENIPALIIERERFFKGDAYLPELREAGADLLVLAGFLWKIPQSLIDAFPRRIVNIHPALLPKYGGKGMYGQFVHQAVIGAGEVQSGITIHYVDEHYDNGDIIFQTACPVLPGDTPEQLAQRIHQLEHLHYPRVVAEAVEQMNR